MGIDWALLLAALISVESNGITDAVGDGGKAVGVLQIHPICVDDVNRILDLKHHVGGGIPYRYTLKDRLSASTSRGMAITYLRHYGAAYKRNTGKEPTYEIYARTWNGGPSGWKKEATDAYWIKVSAAMDRLRK